MGRGTSEPPPGHQRPLSIEVSGGRASGGRGSGRAVLPSDYSEKRPTRRTENMGRGGGGAGGADREHSPWEAPSTHAPHVLRAARHPDQTLRFKAQHDGVGDGAQGRAGKRGGDRHLPEGPYSASWVASPVLET